jgi:hypothetical protein
VAPIVGAAATAAEAGRVSLWIRVDTSVARDPAVSSFADAIGTSIPTAVGHLVLLWGCMAEHTPQGVLTSVGVRPLEAWAGWSGKRGRFFEAFHAHFVIDGEVKGWLARQGKLVERASKDRLRKERQHSMEIPRNVQGNSAPTVRNVTVRKNKSVPAPVGTGPAEPSETPKRAPRIAPRQRDPDAVPAAVLDHLQAAWRVVGSVSVPRFRAAIGPLVRGGFRPGQIARAMRHYAATRQDEGKPAKLEWFCEEVGRWVTEADRHQFEWPMTPAAASGVDDGVAIVIVDAHHVDLEVKDAALLASLTAEEAA